jgi:hypothetical protein
MRPVAAMLQLQPSTAGAAMQASIAKQAALLLLLQAAGVAAEMYSSIAAWYSNAQCV